MTALTVVLVLIAALTHAGWNLIAKRLGDVRGVPFVWSICAASSVLYTPIALVLLARHGLPPLAAFGWMAASAVLHVAYFLLLQRGYRLGDFSIVYPIARGVGPLLAMVGAVALLGERWTPLGVAGALLVSTGVLLVTGAGATPHGPDARAGIGYALATGVVIAMYTLWDARGVRTFAVPALLYDWGCNLARLALVSPAAATRGDEVRALWRRAPGAVVAIGLLSPASYILILIALRLSPVTHVAPMRELSILIGAFLGTRVLGEGDRARRLTAAAVMALGVIALSLA